MLFEKVHPQHLFGSAGVFELAGKCATVVASVFPLHFNSGTFISAFDAKSSKFCDLSDFNWRIKLVSSLKV